MESISRPRKSSFIIDKIIEPSRDKRANKMVHLLEITGSGSENSLCFSFQLNICCKVSE